MTKSDDLLERILGPEGSLSKSLKSFEFRPSQLDMARLIEEAIHAEGPAVIEAGTGTGKTLGYLVPLFLSGKKCVISTATKTLQEQIFRKDIPLLQKATGYRIDAMLMKGRKNYLCLYRYRRQASRKTLFRAEKDIAGERIEEWLKKTQFADRSELPWMRDDDPLWDGISSTSDQCLGSECPDWGDCYLNALRRGAAKAQILIVNHHLFFADLMVKRGGFGEIIPRFQVLLFDEAHAIEEIATSYLGISVSTNQLLDLAADLRSELVRGKGTSKKMEMELDRVRAGCEHLREMLGRGEEKGRIDSETAARIAEGPALEIRQALLGVQKQGMSPSMDTEERGLPVLLKRAAEFERILSQVLSPGDPQWLSWYENRKKSLVLHVSPLEVSGSLRELLYARTRRILFTSATLSTRSTFDYFKERLGLDREILTAVYPSHFDFKEQALLYVPTDLPLPGDAEFAPRISERILDLLLITRGRALVLFTSYQNLRLVSGRLEGRVPFTLLRQGEGPRSLLLDTFRRDTHSVLLATGSFWQGVDVPGEALSSLIVDKLPFDSPGDPLVAARIDLIRSRGENPFMKYQLPSAIISLKQGLGRLIRSSTDRGLLCVLDRRVHSSRYGRFFIESLPPVPLTHDLGEVQRFFAGEGGRPVSH